MPRRSGLTIRRFRPSTVSLRFSVSAGYYRTCVLDGRPRRGARPPGAARMRQGHQDRPGPAAACRRPGHRPGDRISHARAGPAQQPRCPDGPARGHPPPAPPRQGGRDPGDQGTPAYAPPHLRHDHAMPASTSATSRSPPATLTRGRRCGMRSLGNCIRCTKFEWFAGCGGCPGGSGRGARRTGWPGVTQVVSCSQAGYSPPRSSRSQGVCSKLVARRGRCDFHGKVNECW